jgi:hypothetical protein
MNWFERHANWTAGIFGHLLGSYLFFIMVAPFGDATFNLDWLVRRLVYFRSLAYAGYRDFFFALCILLALACYIGLNAWYLKVKHRSYNHLLWLALPLLPLGWQWIGTIFHLHIPSASTPSGKVVAFSLYDMLPIWFILAAIMLLRLKSHNRPMP